MKIQKPKPGTPEYDLWIKKRATERSKKVFSKGPVDFDERGVIAGGERAITEDDKRKDVDKNNNSQSTTK